MPPKFICTSQAGDLQEEVGGGTAVGRRPTSKKKCKMSASQKPDGISACSTIMLASRFYQAKRGIALPGSISIG